MTSKKCISMGLKMNGLSNTNAAVAAVAAAMNGVGGNSNMNHNVNGHKLKAEKNQGNMDPASTFMNHAQSMAESFMKAGGGLSNANSFLPMVPNLQNLPKYENYSVMNAALLASFPFLPINLNPYHIQNLLKLTSNAGVPNLNSPLLHNNHQNHHSNDNSNDNIDDEDHDNNNHQQHDHHEEIMNRKKLMQNAFRQSSNNNHNNHNNR